jgi:hypothetical protein
VSGTYGKFSFTTRIVATKSTLHTFMCVIQQRSRENWGLMKVDTMQTMHLKTGFGLTLPNWSFRILLPVSKNKLF